MARRAWLLIGFLSLGLLPATSHVWGDPPLPASPQPTLADAKAANDDKAAKDDAEYYELYKVLADTVSQVEQNYVKKVDRRKLLEAAIRGVLEELDPYSNYISPEDITRFKTSVENQFEGIGIQVAMEGDQLKVLSPLVGSPAYRAGLQAGDAIVEIEGKSTEKITMDEAVRQLRGVAGTSVKITVVHARGGKRETLSIKRESIQLDTVLGDRRKKDDTWDFMLDHDKKIGYVRITGFSRDTADQLESALEELKSEGMKGLIVDLRFNPGGLLKSATDISDLFVSEGVIVSTEGRNSPKRTVKAKKAGTFEGFPMVVLVNRFSASASEIVSACLQDHHRAIIIGERTWGKGSVQSVVDLEGGKSALKLTTAGYLRPNGHNIHRFPDAKESDEWGVMPDKGYEVKLSDSEMSELSRYRRDRDILLESHAGANKADADKPAEESKKADDKPAAETKKASQPDVKEAEPKTPEKKPEGKPAKSDDDNPKKSAFVDRQLQKALDYLDSQQARS